MYKQVERNYSDKYFEYTYEYDDAKERNEHIVFMCRDGFVCTLVDGYEPMIAKFRKEREEMK